MELYKIELSVYNKEDRYVIKSFNFSKIGDYYIGYGYRIHQTFQFDDIYRNTYYKYYAFCHKKDINKCKKAVKDGMLNAFISDRDKLTSIINRLEHIE